MIYSIRKSHSPNASLLFLRLQKSKTPHWQKPPKSELPLNPRLLYSIVHLETRSGAHGSLSRSVVRVGVDAIVRFERRVDALVVVLGSLEHLLPHASLRLSVLPGGVYAIVSLECRVDALVVVLGSLVDFVCCVLQGE
jgi:hypothetical protein